MKKKIGKYKDLAFITFSNLLALEPSIFSSHVCGLLTTSFVTPSSAIVTSVSSLICFLLIYFYASTSIHSIFICSNTFTLVFSIFVCSEAFALIYSILVFLGASIPDLIFSLISLPIYHINSTSLS